MLSSFYEYVIASRWKAFLTHESGQVAIIFALASIPLIMGVGTAVDYSFANRDKAALDSYADAAALSVVSQSALSETAAQAKKNAVSFFKADAANITGVTLSKVSAKVTDSASGRTVVVTYAASMPTDIMGIADINSLNLSGSSTAASGLPTYIDFYLLLDNTPSMGVGATPTDVATMVSNTPDQCAFACHEMDTSPNDYYGLAKKLGVTMRIDVVRTATQQLMDTANATETVPDQFRMAIYTFGSSAQNVGLDNIYDLSSDLSSAKSAANNIDLMTVPYQNYADDTATDFDDVLFAINKEIPDPGSGTTSTSPQKFLFFVSDGVADEVNSSACTQPTTNGQDPQTGKQYVRCQEPLTVSLCDALKSRGVNIAVLYTTYLALPTNAWYMSWIDPFNQGPYDPSVNSKIAQDMQSCASPGLYFEVSPTDGIAQAMTALFQKAVTQARLTK